MPKISWAGFVDTDPNILVVVDTEFDCADVDAGVKLKLENDSDEDSLLLAPNKFFAVCCVPGAKSILKMFFVVNIKFLASQLFTL